MEGQMPFEEWIYGKPPQVVEFVRVNGNRVIRVEIAKMGEKPEIFTKDVVEGLMRTDGTPLDPAAQARVAKNGDVQRDPNTQEAAPPPTLRKPGETLPSEDQDPDSQRVGEMRPVRFPAPKPAAQPGDNPDGEPAATPANSGAPLPDASQPSPTTTPAKQPATPPGQQPASGPPAQQFVQSTAVAGSR
jgi:hypothetical protein